MIRWFRQLLLQKSVVDDKGQHRLLSMLSHFSWRTEKKDVADEFKLPAQHHASYHVHFTELELYCYRQLLDDCRSRIAKAVERHALPPDMTLSDLDTSTCKVLLGPMLDLRKACCHPNTRSLQGITAARAHTSTMHSVKEDMIKKAQHECSLAHRELCFALNGLAGVALLDMEYSQAYNYYRRVIGLYKKYASEFSCDRLQVRGVSFGCAWQAQGESGKGVSE